MEEKLSRAKSKLEMGQSLFEVVVAIAISALVMVSVVALATLAVRNTTFSKNKTLASRYAEEALEWLRNERDKDVSAFLNKAQIPKWCLNQLSWSNQNPCSPNEKITGTPFLREVSFSNVGLPPDTIIEAVVKVEWVDSQGSHLVQNVTNFADWRQR